MPPNSPARLDRRALIDALDAAFRQPCSVPTRWRHHVESAVPGESGGTLLLMPAWKPGGALGIKIASVYPDNARKGLPAVCAIYLLLDAATGQPRAILDGEELTLRRTGAASALASRHLSSPAASRLLMVGTGRLAPHLIESHLLVRPIREVRIWGRQADRARALARSLARADIAVEATEDLEAAVRWADVVSCATLSRQPLVHGAWLEGRDSTWIWSAPIPRTCARPTMRRSRAPNCSSTPAPARSANPVKSWAPSRAASSIKAPIRAELSELGSGSFSRSSPQAITLFKSVGTALEDLVAAELAMA